MGVYIKGMEMPESCVLCRLECLYRIHNSGSRSKYCPLVEVRIPHGRLIDTDALARKIVESNYGVDFINKTTALIMNTPTVIEAEESE